MKKIMLITGCSHAAGSEIDGTEDSQYNRQNSFGNLLANKMGYEPINIAENGGNNPAILRTTLEWFNEEYDPAKMEIFVLVAWSESSRLQLPVDGNLGHGNLYANWRSKTSPGYMYINQGYPGGTPAEIEMMPYYHKFIANHLLYLELTSINLVLQMQYFLKMKNIKYLMCNTMHMIDNSYKHNSFYVDLVDRTKYMYLLESDLAFFWKYRYLGYSNPKAKYWHHNEEPHRLYADLLYKFIEDNHVHN
jgi:hypothetical protein